MSDPEPAWPTELRVTDAGRSLHVTFEDGASYALPAEMLRVESPSAEVQGHAPGERKIIGGKRRVAIRAADPVGNYAIKLTFDDGHNTGLYTWRFLHDLGANLDAVSAAYAAALDARGLSRD